MVDKFFLFFFRKPFDLVVYVWVSAQKSIMPTITIEESINACYKFFNIKPAERNAKTAQRQYTRTQQRFFKSLKKNGKDI